MPSTDDELRAPPQLELADPGLVWREEDGGLTIERKPTFRAALKYLAFVLVFGALAILNRSSPLVVLFGAGVVLGIAGLVLLWPLRVRIHLDRSGASWSRSGGPRVGAGAWPPIEGARVRLGERRSIRMSRLVGADVRVRGQWVAIATGTSEQRARALANAIARASGVQITTAIEEGAPP